MIGSNILGTSFPNPLSNSTFLDRKVMEQSKVSKSEPVSLRIDFSAE